MPGELKIGYSQIPTEASGAKEKTQTFKFPVLVSANQFNNLSVWQYPTSNDQSPSIFIQPLITVTLNNVVSTFNT